MTDIIQKYPNKDPQFGFHYIVQRGSYYIKLTPVQPYDGKGKKKKGSFFYIEMKILTALELKKKQAENQELLLKKMQEHIDRCLSQVDAERVQPKIEKILKQRKNAPTN